jgi:antitoxin ParD1/3/4
VVLTDRQQKLVEELVASGRYQNASEVLREGLRLLEHRDAEDAARLQALRAAAAVGLAVLDRGDYVEFAEPDELKTYLGDLTERTIQGRIR